VCPAGFFCDGVNATMCPLPRQYQPQLGWNACINTTTCGSPVQFEVRAPTLTTDRRCQTTLLCLNATEYQRAPPTTTSDRLCAPLRTCNAGTEFETAEPTATSDRICKPITQCNLISEQTAVVATPTSDAVCGCRPNFVRSTVLAACVSCQAFVSGCNTCELQAGQQVVCTECLMAMMPIETPEGLRCVRCETAHCARCNEADACVECKPGFKRVFDENGTAVCTCGLLGCAECHGNGTCSTCASGFRHVGDVCLCNQQNCAQCDDSGHCTACNIGWALNASGQCACGAVGCLTCAGSGACMKCRPSFQLLSNATCQCALPGCAECDADGRCVRCSGALRLKPTTNTCECAIANCSACSVDGQTCVSCTSPLVPEGGRCVCGLERCAECNSSGCARCSNNFTLNEAGTCVPITQQQATAERAASVAPWVGTAVAAMVVCGIVVAVCAVHRHRRVAQRRSRTHSPPTLGDKFRPFYAAAGNPPDPPPRMFLRNETYSQPSDGIYEQVEADICCYSRPVPIRRQEPATNPVTYKDDSPVYDLATAGDITTNALARANDSPVYDLGTVMTRADSYSDVDLATEGEPDISTILPEGYLTVLPAANNDK
jgi:hypothetical protein